MLRKLNEWIGFFLAIIVLLLLSQKNLGVAMFAGALILGLFTIPDRLLSSIIYRLTEPSTIVLAIIVALIPVIGGILNETGEMDSLLQNLRIGKKLFLMFSPALIGLLPMPGGALISAPMVEKAGNGMPDDKKAAVNVWFRHILYLIYPISSAFIISTKAANLNLYAPIPYLMILFIFSLLIGYLFFLRGPSEKLRYEGAFSLKGLLQPLTILLIAPLIDIILKTFVRLPVKEVATLIAVATSLVLAIIVERDKPSLIRRAAIKAKPWNFAFMMFGIMLFIGVFKDSGISELFRNQPMSFESILLLGFALGFVTGRVVTPAGIVFPISLSAFGSISPYIFSLIYFGIFLGYLLTPVHPCISLTIEFMKVDLKNYIRRVAPPAIISLFISLVLIHFPIL